VHFIRLVFCAKEAGWSTPDNGLEANVAVLPTYLSIPHGWTRMYAAKVTRYVPLSGKSFVALALSKKLGWDSLGVISFTDEDRPSC